MRVPGREFYRRLLDSGNVLFLCHRNADPDAIGSAFSLAEAAGGRVGAVDTLNRAAEAVVRHLDIKVILKPAVEDYDLVVVVDASAGAQINDLQPRRFAFIDHHASIPLADRAEFYLHDDSARSSSEMVYRLLKEEGIYVTGRMATALLAGILTDTANFKFASSGTLLTAAELMDISGAGLDDVYSILSSVPADASMRIAVL
ncbi:MAG TPA: bifunctional oligoribonuclease/PAP phosphatase NrnA, partial [Candidatus Methanoperedenaceae archaeon]|nr:bifunctional oligoribonuclease/PAP phosphatase NrnA [Candidatus Methanoperedenaceae archaeon]